MRVKKSKRPVSILLVLAMLVSLLVIPAAAESAEDSSIVLSGPIHTDSVSASVTVTGNDSFIGGRLILTTGPASNTDDADSRTQLTSVPFTGADTYDLSFPKSAKLKEGETVLVHLYHYDAEHDSTNYQYGNAVAITAGGKQPAPDVTPGQTPDQILANCSAVILKDGQPRSLPFREEETSVDVQVKLDPGVEECHLTIFSYASNTAFDPDSSHNIRLAGQTVRDGDVVTLNFRKNALPLKFGYSIIATLNVPVGPDWYKPVNSQPLNIVNQDGETFRDYDPYPDASITETTLMPGADTLHISLKADPRLFQAAKEGKTSLNLSVAQYPDGASFDFESEEQISVFSGFHVTEPISNQEITLSEPLRPGYRVRAVVYWEQSPEIFLVKGNDYEAMFHRPDDSVLVSGEAPAPDALSTVIAGPVTPSSKAISVRTTGTIPAGSRLLLKAYGGSDPIVLSGGTTLAAADAAPSVTLTPASEPKVGDQLVAFVLNQGRLSAQSQPLIVVKDAPPAAQGSIVIQEPLTPESRSASVTVTGCDAFKGGRLILTIGDSMFNDLQLVNVAFTGDGTYPVTFNPIYPLHSGDQILPYLYLGAETPAKTLAGTLSVVGGSAPAPEVLTTAISGTVSTDSRTISVKTTGPIPDGVLLLAKTFGPSDPIASDRGTVVSAPVAAAADVQLTLKPDAALKAGDRMVVFVLSGGQTVGQSAPVVIAASGPVTPPAQKVTVTITDKVITKGDTKLNASASWDRELADSARYALYQFTGEALNKDTASKLADGSVNRSYPHMIINVRDQLVVGANLQLVLTVGGNEYRSNILTVSPSPDWGTPAIALNAAAISAEAVSIPVFTQYSEEYLTLGQDFYCDITLYQVPGSITEQEFEEKELWENSSVSTRIGQINSIRGDQTLGHVTVPVLKNVTLTPGSNIIAKLRLPHTEWEGEEVDYISFSVPVVKPGEENLEERVVLLNLGDDTPKGHQVREILAKLGIRAVTVEQKDLDETVGYLAGMPGYAPTEGNFEGKPYTAEFMLLCNLPEPRLDQFLLAMKEQNVFVGHKAMVIPGNKDLQLYELVDMIVDEHAEVMRALLERLVQDAEALKESEYGQRPSWNALQQKIAQAKSLLQDPQAPIEALERTRDELQALYDAVLHNTEPSPDPQPDPQPNPQPFPQPNHTHKPDPLPQGLLFRDVLPSHWFYQDVQYVFDKNLMNGTAPYEFSPHATTTRSMLITILYRMAGSPAVTRDVTFTDVSRDAYYYPALCWAVQEGLATGYDADTFGTHAPVTRQDTATFLYRYMRHQNRITPTGSLARFDDAGTVSSYAADAVSWAVGCGLLNGRDSRTLSPLSTATRAELAALIHRFCTMN